MRSFDGAWGKLLLSQQVKLELPYLVASQLRRGFAEVLGELLDGQNVATRRGW